MIEIIILTQLPIFLLSYYWFYYKKNRKYRLRVYYKLINGVKDKESKYASMFFWPWLLNKPKR